MSIHEPPAAPIEPPHRYAPEYWIVNLAQRCIEAYREPSPAAAGGRATYAVRLEYRDADSVPVYIAGQQIGKIAVAEIVPKA